MQGKCGHDPAGLGWDSVPCISVISQVVALWVGPHQVELLLPLFNCRVVLASCDPMDYSLQDCSVHGILQARILEWVAISLFRGSS